MGKNKTKTKTNTETKTETKTTATSALTKELAHLSELKDASTAGVESVDDLDGLVLPALRQLLHLDPHLRH